MVKCLFSHEKFWKINLSENKNMNIRSEISQNVIFHSTTDYIFDQGVGEVDLGLAIVMHSRSSSLYIYIVLGILQQSVYLLCSIVSK